MSSLLGDLLKLVASVALCLLAGLIGSLFTTPAIPGWYAGLIKPPLNPPAAVFGPVWTLLYLMMALALFLVWRRVRIDWEAGAAVRAFLVQLLLNALWSAAFFGLRSPLAGLVVIALFWLAIVFTILAFRRASPPAAWRLN